MGHPLDHFVASNYNFLFPQNDMKPVMLALFGVSVFIGLPLHIFALGDLGEALYEAEEIFMRTNSGTQTEDDHVIRVCIEQRY